MKKLAAPGGSVVIDLACGTGDFCREIEKAGMVPVGLDLSMGMLAAARTGAPLVHADILAMPLADGSVDGATCGFALRNLIELPGFFDEAGALCPVLACLLAGLLSEAIALAKGSVSEEAQQLRRVRLQGSSHVLHAHFILPSPRMLCGC